VDGVLEAVQAVFMGTNEQYRHALSLRRVAEPVNCVRANRPKTGNVAVARAAFMNGRQATSYPMVGESDIDDKKCQHIGLFAPSFVKTARIQAEQGICDSLLS
jgi:hypothetical protein